MSKRFVDTEIWCDKWYRKMPCKYKELWRYVCENCDNAGVWKVDFDLAIFQIGEVLDHDEALRFLNDGKERISVLNHGTYWQIKDYVHFQFGVLSEKSRVHESVFKLIELHRVSKGYQYPMDRAKDKDKDKDKEIGGVGDFDALEAFNVLLAAYPVKIGESRARQTFFQWNVTSEMVARILKGIQNYKKHLEANEWKKPMNFNTWLGEWLDWENYTEIETEDQRHERLKARLKA